MVDVRTPASIGAVSAVVYALATLVPAVAGDVPGGALETYYSQFGIVGPPYVAVLALVAVVVLLAGRQGRASADVVAGVALVVGLMMVVLTALWAFGGATELVGSLSEAAWLEFHPWVLLASALGLLLGAVWFADAIGVLRARAPATR